VEKVYRTLGFIQSFNNSKGKRKMVDGKINQGKLGGM
jgi:hypothetical protein